MNRTLILVDAMSGLYRAFHAIRGLATRAGLPTNAVFGFVRMMEQIRDILKPTHCIVVFDGGTPESRLALLPQYKAQRPPMPEGLRQQLPLIVEYLDRSHTAWLRIEKEEADDVIATLTEKARSEADRVLLATSDKDMYQLVGENVQMVHVHGGCAILGTAEVKAKTGVLPEQVVEWLALVGDSSDNIPGVPGIGSKTAAKLLQEYGSVDAVLNRVDELTPKHKESLLASRDVLRRNMELVRLRRDLNVELSWTESAIKAPDSASLLLFFERLEFESLARNLRQPSLF